MSSASAPAALAPPAAPTGLTARAVSRLRIDLAWTDNSGNESGFTIERSTDGVTFTEIATVAANCPDGLEPAALRLHEVLLSRARLQRRRELRVLQRGERPHQVLLIAPQK